MARIRGATVRDSTDLFEVAKTITHAHADLLNNNVEPTVTALLIRIGRCPSCAGPLILGDRIGFCTDCGSEVDRC